MWTHPLLLASINMRLLILKVAKNANVPTHDDAATHGDATYCFEGPFLRMNQPILLLLVYLIHHLACNCILKYSSCIVDINECSLPHLKSLCQQDCVNTQGRLAIFVWFLKNWLHMIVRFHIFYIVIFPSSLWLQIAQLI